MGGRHKIQDELMIELQNSLENLALISGLHTAPQILFESIARDIEKFGLTKSTEPRDLLRGERYHATNRESMYFKAITYWIMADNSRLTDKPLDAWQLLCKSNYLIGMVHGLNQPKQSNGSRARSEISQKNKIAIAELLAKKRPKDGWTSEREAAKQILEDAVKLNAERNMNYVVGNLLNLVTEWQKSDPVVRAAFLGRHHFE